jgi:CheY-like chemotaxis protein/PAS domain-containing protein
MTHDASAVAVDPRTIIESLGGIVWEASVDPLTFLYVSPKAEEIVGAAPSEWRETEFLRLHTHSEDLERCMKSLAAAAEPGGRCEFEHRFLARDGRVVALRTTVTGALSPAGDVRLRGFTAQSAQDTGRGGEVPAAAPAGIAERLPVGLAHDFNNLLTVIAGYAETLLGSIDRADPLAADVAEIQRAADRAATLMHSMLMAGARRPAAADTAAAGVTLATVLLAEDDERVRDLAIKVLRRNGYRVLAAASGEEALALCHAHAEPVDVLLTDVVMGGMSGPELATIVSSLQPELPVLFMSGYAADLVDDLAPGLGTVTMLAKPFTPAALVASIGQVLARAASPR